MSVIANRYIQALLELPKSEEENKMLEKGLKDVAELFSSNEEFRRVVNDPRITNDIKIEIVKEILPQYKNAVFMNFISLIIKEKRINFIEEIAEQYEQINKEINKELKIKIISAYKIDDEQIKKIVEKYKTMYKVKTINYELEVDESLLGGVKVIVGNKVYDGSVISQLKQMF